MDLFNSYNADRAEAEGQAVLNSGGQVSAGFNII